jgi:hypothetical protein
MRVVGLNEPAAERGGAHDGGGRDHAELAYRAGHDRGAGAAETEEVSRLAGLIDVVAQGGATFFDHNRPPSTAVPLECKPEADVEGPQHSVMVNRVPRGALPWSWLPAAAVALLLTVLRRSG